MTFALSTIGKPYYRGVVRISEPSLYLANFFQLFDNFVTILSLRCRKVAFARVARLAVGSTTPDLGGARCIHVGETP